MLVVMALIGLLAAMISTVLVRTRHKSVQIGCMANLQEMGKAMTSFAFDQAGAYPSLYADAAKLDDGEVQARNSLAGGGAIPWWLVVHNEIYAENALDPDNLPAQLPSSLQLFHCRAATRSPVLDPDAGEAIAELDERISYGLNYDLKRDDGTLYEYAPGSPPLAGGATTAADRNPDVFTRMEIGDPAAFVLISEANTGDNQGGRVRCHATSSTPSDPASNLEAVVGRHGGEANVLYADGHVGTANINVPGEAATPLNEDTPLWTLPED
jgi:prepilin-type processing-associated H-X9-DG protein